MKENIIYRERQRFRQWWIWVLIIGLNGFFLLAVYFQILLGQPFGERPMGNVSLIIVTIINFGMTLLFFSFRLETIITTESVSVRFFPFHIKPVVITKQQIKNAFVREYKPIREYGGWGLKGSSKNKAYNVSGNVGLQLILKDEAKVLIGTNNHDELEKAMELFRQNPIITS